MEICDYNKYSRDLLFTIFKNLTDTQKREHPNQNDEEIFMNIMQGFSISIDFFRNSEANPFISKNTATYTNVILSLIMAVSFSDLYIDLHYDILRGINVKENQRIVSKLVKYHDNLDELLKNPVYLCKFICASYKFHDAAAFEKILRIKALKEVDKKAISLVNPFSSAEIDKYDIDITLEFINKHINRLTKAFDEDTAYNMTYNFLLELKDIDIKTVCNCLSELTNTNVTLENIENILVDKEGIINYLKEMTKRFNEQCLKK